MGANSMMEKQESYGRVLMERRMTDIHCHLVPGVDDGAASMDMAMEMLRLSAEHGIAGVFATPHSSAFDLWDDEAGEQFRRLKEQARRLFPDMALYSGCEVYCEARRMDAVIAALETGKYPSMNGTKYILMEFSPWVKPEEAKSCAQAFLDYGWKPIIAHMERYKYLQGLPKLVNQFRKMGCLIQINAYSVVEETNAAIRQWTRQLLEQRQVDFLGTDAHRTGHRPPNAKTGLRWLYENCERDYADAVAYGNAERLLMK